LKRIFLAAAFLLFIAHRIPAQTISPPIVEYNGKAEGKFSVYNDADIPMTVVVEPHSFSVDSTGRATFRKLDPGIHVEISSTSFRIAPKQTYYVFYKASTETFPNWFCIYATFTGATTKEGIKLALELPHTVYLLDKKTLEQSQISWNKAELSMVGDKRVISAEVENHGTEYGRVEDVEIVSSSGKHSSFGGFPLFPGQHRQIQVEWDEAGTPQQIVLKFAHFKMESELKAANTEQ
jgi:hypothetical protein